MQEGTGGRRRVQEGAGGCRMVQEGVGGCGCRRVQEGAGGYRTAGGCRRVQEGYRRVQEGTGGCRKVQEGAGGVGVKVRRNLFYVKSTSIVSVYSMYTVQYIHICSFFLIIYKYNHPYSNFSSKISV